MGRICTAIGLSFIVVFVSLPLTGFAVEKETLSADQLFEKRMELYQKVETITNVPWHYLAAVDTYERGLRRTQKDRPNEEGVIAIFFSEEEWAGAM